MLTPMLPATAFEVNTEIDPVASAHTDARNLITWLTTPGVSERYGIAEAAWVVSMLNILITSTTPEDAVSEIKYLVSYIRKLVGAVHNV